MLLVGGICSLIEKLLASMASAVIVSKAAPCRKHALVASAHIFQTTPNFPQASCRLGCPCTGASQALTTLTGLELKFYSVHAVCVAEVHGPATGASM